MQGPKKGQPTYLGLFACDPKGAVKTVKETCRQAILDVLKHAKPEGYLGEGEDIPKVEHSHELQRQLTEQQISSIEKDYSFFEAFNTPKDNYHMTCLFIGKNKDKLKKEEKQILSNWKDGVQERINVDFIAYVPNHLLAGSVCEVGKVEVGNRCPHMTLLIREKAKAVESNDVLEMVLAKAPQLFKQRHKKVIVLDIPYSNVSKSIILVSNPFNLDAIAGDNCSHGKK